MATAPESFFYLFFLYPPRNLIDQALAHCSHSLLQPPGGVRILLHFHAAVHPLKQLEITGL